MNALFNLCVAAMIELSHITGLSYQEINIWLFVIIHPLVTALFIATTWLYRSKYKSLKHL